MASMKTGGVMRRSEVELHAQLHLARGERRGDRPEGARGAAAVRRLEVRRVEQVERLDARLDASRIPLQAERLVEPEIHLVERRPARDVPWRIPEGLRPVRRDLHRRRVQVIVDATVRREWIAREV